MNPIPPPNALSHPAYAADALLPAKSSGAAKGAAAQAGGASSDGVSHTTRISQAGRALAQRGQSANAAAAGGGDVIESLRETLLDQIKQWQEQLAKKREELLELMANKALTPEQKEARLSALYAEIRALQSAIATAQGQLLTLERKNLHKASA